MIRLAVLMTLIPLPSAVADPQGEFPILGQYRNTYYYVIDEATYANAPIDNELLTMKDEVLARVSTAFKGALDVEGTGMLIDGRVVNFGGRKNGTNRYIISQNPYGDGTGHCALKPYHSIAVDPRTIPLGSLVQIDETIGMPLPDGTLHDGLWRAEDTGSAIKGDRIDLFMGVGNERSAGVPLDRQGIQNLQPLTVRIVESAQPGNCTGE